jgi:hypothetical protein
MEGEFQMLNNHAAIVSFTRLYRVQQLNDAGEDAE